MQGHQRRQVVDVLEHLANRLQDDREGRIAGRDLEQLRRALTLLPQRRAPAGVATREQQRPGRALAEPRGEQRRAADLGGDDLLELVGLEGDQLGARRVLVGLRDPQHDAVVGGHRLGVDAVALAQAGVDRQGPGRVHRRAVRRVHHQAPVAELVTEALDHELLVVRDDLGGLLLLLDQRDQVARGPLVEAGGRGARDRLLGGHRGHLAGERADRRSQLGRASQRVAGPERQPPRLTGRRGDEHPVVGDVLDAPAGGAQREDVAHPRLVDHLLVELTDARLPSRGARGGRGADEEDPEQAAVGNRPTAGHRQLAALRVAR